MPRVTRTGLSQSEKAFRVLLNDSRLPSRIDDDTYFNTVKAFFYQLNLIAKSCEYAKNDLLAQSIATYSLREQGVFKPYEMKKIRAWLTDKRFKVLISHMLTWYEPSQEVKSIIDIVASSYPEKGHAADDVLGILSSLMGKKQRYRLYDSIMRLKIANNNYYALMQNSDYREKAQTRDAKLFEGVDADDYTKKHIIMLLDMEKSKRGENAFTIEERQQIINFANNKSRIMKNCRSTLKSLDKEIAENLQVVVASDVDHFLNALKTDDVSVLDIIYDFFYSMEEGSRSKDIRRYSSEKLTEYFKILLQTLALFVEENISMSVYEILNDAYFDSSKDDLDSIVSSIYLSKIKELYFCLLSLVANCATIPDCAKKLADKFIKHKAQYDWLQLSRPADENCEKSSTFKKSENDLRAEFIKCSQEQTALNEQAQFDLQRYMQEITRHETQRKMSIGELDKDAENYDTEKERIWNEFLDKRHKLLNTFQTKDYLKGYLYQREITLIESAYDKECAIAKNDQQLIKASLRKDQRVSDAKDQFGSSGEFKESYVRTLPCTKYTIDTDTAIAVTITYQCDRHDFSLRANSYYQKTSKPEAELSDSDQTDSYVMIRKRHDPKNRREFNLASKNRVDRNWRIARYVGFGVLGVIGLGLLGLATASTLGLIHLAWVVPVIYFAAGGGVTAGSIAGSIVNSPTCRRAVSRVCGLSRNFYTTFINNYSDDEPTLPWNSASEDGTAFEVGDDDRTSMRSASSVGSLS